MTAQSTETTQYMGRERAPSEVFDLPVEKIREGYYSDTYFRLTQAIVAGKLPNVNVLMQVFQKHEAVLGGIDEAIAVIRECSGEMMMEWGPHRHPYWGSGWDQLTVKALYEADEIHPYEPVLTIEGPYRLFAHLETVYLGVLARRTRIATNVSKVCKAANGKPIMFFPARHDHWVVQTGDGYAAHYAGAIGVSTDAQATWWGGKGVGTMPHALIAAFGGDTVRAAIAFAEMYGHETNVQVLVDFDNRCPSTAVEVADALYARGLDLHSVRLDTSGTMVDYDLIEQGLGQFKPTGVNPELVHLVRRELDRSGHSNVKIIVSGGFTPEKIRQFEEANVPVDAYGVGSSLIQGEFDFTADIVRVNDNSCSKEGRVEIANPRLKVVE